MKLRWKLTCCLTALLGALFLLGGYQMVTANFNEALDTAAADACRNHNQQLTALNDALLELRYAAGGLQASDYGEAARKLGGAFSVLGKGYATLHAGLPEALEKRMLADAIGAGPGSAIYREAAGRTYLLTATALYAGEDAYLVSAADCTSLFTARSAWLRRFWALGGAALAAIALLCTGLLWYFLRPLDKLALAGKAIAAGDYHARTGLAGEDELGTVGRSFDQMAAAVEQNVAALELSVRQRDDFVAAFTHELKTPMTAMLGYSDLLRSREVPAAARQKALDYLYHETRRLSALSGKLLALLRLNGETVQPGPTALQAIFSDARQALASWETVTFRFDPLTAAVRADRTLIADLLVNLCQNAAKASAAGGVVRVTAAPTGGRLRLSVRDEGWGIPAAELPRVTEPFYMVDKSRARAQNGSGLGLALCQKIAGAHGTSLEFESAEGVGTTVSFWLEVCDDAQDR